jgi:hypothetical protein
MHRKILISLLGIVFIVLELAGCGNPSPETNLTPTSLSPIAGGTATFSQNDLTQEEIREKVLAVIGDIRTYSFTMILDINLTGQNQKAINQHTEINGAMDKTNQKLHISMDLSQQSGNDRVKGATSTAEIYVAGESMYVKSGASASGTWQKQPASAEIWQEQDIISQQKKLLETAEMELTGIATLKDKQCYLLEIHPDEEALWETVRQKLTAGQLPQGVDLNEIMREISMKTWIDRGTFLPLRVQESITLVMRPEELGLTASDGASAMNVKMDFDLLAFDYNQPLNLEPPAGISD